MKKLFPLLLVIFVSMGPFQAYSQNKSGEIPLDKKIGQMLMVGFRGLEITHDNPITNEIKNHYLGGVILFDYDIPADTSIRNISSPSQLSDLTSELQQLANPPLFIAIDQEGGNVARLNTRHGFNTSVTVQYLGYLDNPDSTRSYALRTARTLKKMGINMNLAPVVDLNTNPQNPVIGNIGRSFSADPGIVIKHAKIFIEAHHQYHIITTLKHFPGHGSSKEDSHLGVTDVSETWQMKELVPYRRLSGLELADVVMTAHIFNARLDSTFPATLSKPTIRGLLRNELGYKGVVMSDDLQMKAIRSHYGLKETIKQSLLAGVDILVFANNSVFDPRIAEKARALITELIKEDTIDPRIIDNSYERIMKLKRKFLKDHD